MNLPVQPPLAPMLAQLVREIPVGDDLLYEPKWDGFRGIVYRDGAEILLVSRNERDMTRYFPELAAALKRELPRRIVTDGEIVIATDHGLDFDALLMRIHPAASRVERLARETPASYVAFDLLALGETDLRERPLRERRAKLEKALAAAQPPLHVSPSTTDPDLAREWFRRFEGAGLDGVMAKRLGLPYIEGRREMFKVKHERTADCVVAGYREHKNADGVGSLLLGLYDERGRLQHVGIASGFAKQQRAELAKEIAPLRRGASRDHPWIDETDGVEEGQRRPGGPSRWSGDRDLSWEPLRPERVAEVRYDHLQGNRFRHATHFLRWRPDREPRSCTYSQLETPAPHELAAIFGRSPEPKRGGTSRRRPSRSA
jgi:ATP-dependent DNA ligase